MFRRRKAIDLLLGTASTSTSVDRGYEKRQKFVPFTREL